MSIRDDRVLLFTRVVAAVVIVILISAWVVLFLLPDRTDRWFAWTVEPTMTAMLMGAGYGSALYFFVQVFAGRRWHLVSLGFIPTTVFVWMMLGLTILHWDRFRHGSLPFWIWIWAYFLTPVLVPVLWLLNRRRDPATTETQDATMPRWCRVAMAAAGIGILAISLWMYVAPESAVGLWPWALTPLTARAVASFAALPGVAWLAMAGDGRWSAARATLATLAIGLVLLIVAVLRAWGQFDHGNALSFVYVAGLVVTLGAIVALVGWMWSRRRAVPARP